MTGLMCSRAEIARTGKPSASNRKISSLARRQARCGRGGHARRVLAVSSGWPLSGLSDPSQHIERRHRLATVQQVHHRPLALRRRLYQSNTHRQTLAFGRVHRPPTAESPSVALRRGPAVTRRSPTGKPRSPVALQPCGTRSSADRAFSGAPVASSSCSYAGFQKTIRITLPRRRQRRRQPCETGNQRASASIRPLCNAAGYAFRSWVA